MKAADARRQGSRYRKRIRSIARDAANDARRVLADRLLSALDANAAAKSANETLDAVLDEMSRLDGKLAMLAELKTWIERFVELQVQWVDCGAHVDADAAICVWNRMDKIIRTVSSEADRRRQLDLIQNELPPLVDSAMLVIRQSSPSTVSSLAPPDSLYTRQPHASSGIVDALRTLPSIELPFQWLPRIVREICASVEQEHVAGRCRPSLVDATRRILTVIRDENPYAFFSVLYRPPPVSVEGVARKWVLHASHQVDSIAALLHWDFNELHNLAHWMQNPDTTFWQRFTQLMRCVRRLAIAFHRVMIHLYAASMQRQQSYVTADDVAFEIKRALAAHTAFTLQSQSYGLAQWLETADDAILHETYAMFPEVLVYMDQWRHEFSVYEHGFAPDERARDYEVGFHKWKSSKAWLEIAKQAQRIAEAWHRSRLGSRDYRPLTFQQLGGLEKDMKHRLAKITDLLYRQNLAKWSHQRYNHARARALMEMQIMADDRDGAAASGTTIKPTTLPTMNTRVHGGASAKKHLFRPPSRSTIVAAPGAGVVCAGVADVLVDEEDILKWTDEEIDAHEQETEHVYDLQSAMLAAHDKLSLPQLLCTTSAGDELDAGFASDDLTDARGLLASCRRVEALARGVVARGEDIAFHGAAEALIQRPSLRTFGASHSPEPSRHVHNDALPLPLPSPPPEASSLVADLEFAVRGSALRLLNLHQEATTDPEAVESARELAREALGLLQRAQAA